jgi:hypothetical protein
MQIVSCSCHRAKALPLGSNRVMIAALLVCMIEAGLPLIRTVDLRNRWEPEDEMFQPQ